MSSCNIFLFGSGHVGIKGPSRWRSGMVSCAAFPLRCQAFLVSLFRLGTDFKTGLGTCPALIQFSIPLTFWINQKCLLWNRKTVFEGVWEKCLFPAQSYYQKSNAPAIPSIVQRGDIMRTMPKSWQDSSSWWYPLPLNSVSPNVCIRRMHVCPCSYS